ncbi:MAG TPA: hypothetical protein PKD09_02050 [Aggregatilinea sp.]|uniref:hypothetical protein n=1 Tax=Aggregatilinea sp. TaxID=2806333 RepID=UPI002C64A4DF|nr:hypothetical protein [Aggregatilinea sp.]HML20400.1 hypothetical protein [Aggregatilinea sp.]
MSGFAWLGVLGSAFATTLALAAWIVMAIPYLDNAPYITELRYNTRKPLQLGIVMFAAFFAIFFLGARYLTEDTSGPMLLFGGVIVALPISMLLGSETWEHYNPKGMDRAPGPQAIAIATSIGLAELVGVSVTALVLLQLG